jgi:hypothetical protein
MQTYDALLDRSDSFRIGALGTSAVGCATVLVNGAT